MPRYKTIARRGTSDARAFRRMLSRAPETSVPSILSKESRVVEPIVISDDDEVPAPPLQPSVDIHQPPPPSTPTAVPSPLSSYEDRVTSLRQRVADIRRDFDAVLAENKVLVDNPKDF